MLAVVRRLKTSGRAARWAVAIGSTCVVAVAAFAALQPAREYSPSGRRGQVAVEGPLVTRGYVEAPSSTVTLAGYPEGGGIVQELRVRNGQPVKAGEIIARLSNFEPSDSEVTFLKGDIRKQMLAREAMLSGYRTSEIGMQELVVNTKRDELRLKKLELDRSGKPPDQKETELNIARGAHDQEAAKLQFEKDKLAADLADASAKLKILQPQLEKAEIMRDRSLVKSPIDGTVVEVFCQPGEAIGQRGIVKIVDMNGLRVISKINDLHLGRVRVGGKVNITFRRSTTLHRGTIVRIADVVSRSDNAGRGNDFTSQGPSLLEVEIQLDDLSAVPKLIGLETAITYL